MGCLKGCLTDTHPARYPTPIVLKVYATQHTDIIHLGRYLGQANSGIFKIGGVGFTNHWFLQTRKSFRVCTYRREKALGNEKATKAIKRWWLCMLVALKVSAY